MHIHIHIPASGSPQICSFLVHFAQQYEMTGHTARVLIHVIHAIFPQHVFPQFGEILTIRYPDLYVYNFFLWDYMKVNVYNHRCSNIQELKHSIRQEITTRWTEQ